MAVLRAFAAMSYLTTLVRQKYGRTDRMYLKYVYARMRRTVRVNVTYNGHGFYIRHMRSRRISPGARRTRRAQRDLTENIFSTAGASSPLKIFTNRQRRARVPV